ncbi:hypothetical protein [Salipiger thiooxidans]|uniref:hypothetical protein n=1 Tax=Salipiger thiooxidans TaxID=282683 RepID=UPI001CD2DF78|nr:hypothetical protein [Salipiger thiooxidans]MCA0851520.1 hypothetical protein [Salipiger thiooxidans]
MARDFHCPGDAAHAAVFRSGGFSGVAVADRVTVISRVGAVRGTDTNASTFNKLAQELIEGGHDIPATSLDVNVTDDRGHAVRDRDGLHLYIRTQQRLRRMYFDQAYGSPGLIRAHEVCGGAEIALGRFAIGPEG